MPVCRAGRGRGGGEAGAPDGPGPGGRDRARRFHEPPGPSPRVTDRCGPRGATPPTTRPGVSRVAWAAARSGKHNSGTRPGPGAAAGPRAPWPGPVRRAPACREPSTRTRCAGRSSSGIRRGRLRHPTDGFRRTRPGAGARPRRTCPQTVRLVRAGDARTDRPTPLTSRSPPDREERLVKPGGDRAEAMPL
jgi:hypothetical protein